MARSYYEPYESIAAQYTSIAVAWSSSSNGYTANSTFTVNVISNTLSSSLITPFSLSELKWEVFYAVMFWCKFYYGIPLIPGIPYTHKKTKITWLTALCWTSQIGNESWKTTVSNIKNNWKETNSSIGAFMIILEGVCNAWNSLYNVDRTRNSEC